MGAMISLVVCTLGRKDPLRRLLNSLAKQTYRPFEIIIADQNPRGYLDPVLDEYPGLPIIRVHSERGLSRGRNAGLERTCGGIIGFPDDDCWYDPQVLQSVERILAQHAEIDFLS